uniref:Uncharacterized protein n=2 Tax=Rhizophora mucronata TaxID=61149 RepID=A0A2P2J7B1_RHIMU
MQQMNSWNVYFRSLQQDGNEIIDLGNGGNGRRLSNFEYRMADVQRRATKKRARSSVQCLQRSPGRADIRIRNNNTRAALVSGINSFDSAKTAENRRNCLVRISNRWSAVGYVQVPTQLHFLLPLGPPESSLRNLHCQLPSPPRRTGGLGFIMKIT